MLGMSPAGARNPRDDRSNMSLLFERNAETVSSDIAFWEDRAYVGNYHGFRIFDISNPAQPQQLHRTRCDGPQNDPVVWGNRLLFLAVDRTMSGEECGAKRVAHDDPTGWEGVRIFDVSNPRRPRFIDGVYTDCGAHTITLLPREDEGRLLLYVSSYPLRPGPTCGPVNGPANGESPLHEKISVIEVPLNAPQRARVIAEPRVVYPGDPDGKYDPDEHGLSGFNDLIGCHDITVFVELDLAAAACAEQTQLWTIREDGIPNTQDPVWVFDDPRIDFHHSTTFTWDAKVIAVTDESFRDVGCETPADPHGRLYFVDAETGAHLSDFMIPRPQVDAYCSAHIQNVLPLENRYILFGAWYEGGVDAIEFTNPAKPTEIAYYDRVNSDTWAAYWYEGPNLPGQGEPMYANDINLGFQVFRVHNVPHPEVSFDHLNPQTQEQVLFD